MAGAGAVKDLDKLARTIRSLPGYECVKQTRGSHGGGAWLVQKDGKFLMRFTSVNANALTLHKIKQDLRRHGVPFEASKEEVKEMATVTDASRQATVQLVERIRARLDALGGDTHASRRELAGRAVEIIDFRKRQGMEDVEQFGSTGRGKSPPRDVARESMRGLLDDERAATPKSMARWTAVLDAIDRQDSEIEQAATAVIDSVSEQPTPEQEPVEPMPEVRPGEPEPLKGPVAPPPTSVPPVKDEDEAEERPIEHIDMVELRERAELAESVVEEVEKERDAARQGGAEALAKLGEAQSQLDATTKERDRLKKEVAKAETRLRESAEKGDADAELKKQVRVLKSELTKTKRRVGQAAGATSRQRNIAAKLRERLEGTEAAMTEVTDRLMAEKQNAIENMALAEASARDALAFADRMASDMREREVQHEEQLSLMQSRLEDAEAITAGWEAEASATKFKLDAVGVVVDRILGMDGSAF